MPGVRGTCRLDSLRTARIAAGFSIERLARASLTSDLIVNCLEQLPRGGECTVAEADRIAAALSTTVGALGQALL
jgi:hypothetical protein